MVEITMGGWGNSPIYRVIFYCVVAILVVVSKCEVNDKDDDAAVELDKKINEVKTGIDGDEIDTSDVDDAESDDGIVRSEVVTDGDKVDAVLLGTINDLVIR